MTDFFVCSIKSPQCVDKCSKTKFSIAIFLPRVLMCQKRQLSFVDYFTASWRRSVRKFQNYCLSLRSWQESWAVERRRSRDIPSRVYGWELNFEWEHLFQTFLTWFRRRNYLGGLEKKIRAESITSGQLFIAWRCLRKHVWPLPVVGAFHDQCKKKIMINKYSKKHD